jgi:hypothetical protein
MARESREPASNVLGPHIREFELALKHAHGDLWWREFITLIKDRRQAFMETLATQRQDMRMEDTIRGQISELTFILALDLAGAPEREQEHERPRPQPIESIPG